MARKKSADSPARPGHTVLNNEGFFEPFNIDDVPWQRLPGSTAFKLLGRYGGGSQVGVGIDILKPRQYQTSSTTTFARKNTSSSSRAARPWCWATTAT